VQTSFGAVDLFGHCSGAFASSGATAPGFGAGAFDQETQPSFGGSPHESLPALGGAAESTFAFCVPSPLS
jgi:hypothetical protein